MTQLTPPEDPADLIRFIEVEYHAKHRAQLPELAAQSEKVEIVQDVPAGLANLLRRMIGELEGHMKKEELILFPAIRNAPVGSDALKAVELMDGADKQDS
ncbi:hemerythrin domain-containing protein [Aquicoccus sp. SU-CL01552]|uniref:hemerythrin domain-containing protein n=1 Tax=Aquicoccus sp. SU-CL01552 TaxID=3127656 RepID=UPI0031080DFE